MTNTTAAAWVFEGADPEVGIFGDTVVHTCDANMAEDDALDAVMIDLSHRGNADGKTVDVTATFECPACKATTSTTDQQPLSFYAEPGR